MKLEPAHINTNILIQYFNTLLPLEELDEELVTAYFKPRLYRKRQYVLQEGDVCNHLNFVVTGCLRMYKVDEKGNIHILQFASENWWLNNLASFYGRKTSELTIDAIEDTIVLQISYENLLDLYTQSPKFDRIFRILMENNNVALLNRLLYTMSSTAEERYSFFMEVYPHLLNRLPQAQIASFLGITPEFLSRLKNRLLHTKS